MAIFYRRSRDRHCKQSLKRGARALYYSYLRRVERFERVRRRRSLRCLDRTEPATPGARVPQEHDRAGAPVPALSDVGTLGLLADCVQVELLERGLELFVLLSAIKVKKARGRGEG